MKRVSLGWFYKICILLLLLTAFVYTIGKVQRKAVTEARETQYQLALQQLRGVAKLVIWEQDFTLNSTITHKKKYLGVINTEEKLNSNVPGRMGFHIDLADSVNTLIARRGDTIFIQAPLQLTYVQMDMSKLKQVKESSLDPSIDIDKLEAAKLLDAQTVKSYLPGMVQSLQRMGPGAQEAQLARLTGQPVKILYTRLPVVEDWKNGKR